MNWNEKLGYFFKRYLSDLVLAALVIVYIARAIITIGDSGKTIWEMLADGFIALLFSFCISRLFMFRGLIFGQENTGYMATKQEHGAIVSKITYKIELLEGFCVGRNRKEEISRKSAYLLPFGIKYDDFIKPGFSTDGLQKDAVKAVNKARRLKITKLTPDSLLAKSEGSEDRYKFSRSKGQYIKQTTEADVVTKLLLMIPIAYFSVKLIQDFSIELLVWYVLQSVIFLGFGVVKYIMAFNFIVDELREGILCKINLLYEFDNETNKGIKYEEIQNVQSKQDNTARAETETAEAADGAGTECGTATGADDATGANGQPNSQSGAEHKPDVAVSAGGCGDGGSELHTGTSTETGEAKPTGTESGATTATSTGDRVDTLEPAIR